MSSPIGEASVEITADYSKFDRGLVRQLRRAADDAGRAVGDGIRDGVNQGTRTVYRDAAGRLRNERGQFASAGRSAGSSFAEGLKRALTPGIDNILGQLRGSLGARTVGLSVIGAAAAGATGPVLGLASALASTAGAAALIPAAAGAAAAVIGTLRLATVGLEDAFAAVAEGDAEALAEALQRLAPSARALVLAVKEVKPAFDGLRLDLQQRLFAGLAEQIGPLADTYLPGLRLALGGIADTGNRAIRELADLLGTAESAADVFRVLGSAGGAFDNLAAAVAPLTRALLDIAAVGSDFLGPITDGAAAAAQAFADWTAQARASGQLTEIIQTALTALQQLGRIAANVGGIIRAVFAASPDGGGLLATLETVTGAVRDFLASAQGQTALSSFFASTAQVMQALLPVVTTLAGAIGTVLAPAIARIATALGPALQTVASNLATAIAQIDVGTIADALASILSAVAPLLPALGSLVSAALIPLAGALGTVARLAAPFIALFGQSLTAALSAVLPALTTMAQQVLPVAAQAAQAFADAFAPIAPKVAELASLFINQLLPGILPLIPVLAQQLLPQLAEIARVMGGAVMQALTAIAPQLPQLASAMVQLAGAVVNLVIQLAPLLPLATQSAAMIVQLAVASRGLQTGIMLVTGAIQLMASGIQSGMEAMRAIVGVATTVRATFTSLWLTVIGTVRTGINTIVGLVSSLPARIAGLAPRMLAAGRGLINSLMSGLRQVAGGGGLGIAGAIIGAIRGFINRNVLGAIENAINGVLPGSPVRIPRLADGAYLRQPTVALVAEAGPEVVIPLTRPQRAVRLARESGLLQLLQDQGAVGQQQQRQQGEQVPPATINVYSQASDPEQVAYKVVGRLARLGMAG